MNVNYSLESLFGLAYKQNASEAEYHLQRLMNEQRNQLSLVKDEINRFHHNKWDPMPPSLTRAHTRADEIEKNVKMLESLLVSFRLK